jgi:endonuclease YncB( thermonuclease family)
MRDQLGNEVIRPRLAGGVVLALIAVVSSAAAQRVIDGDTIDLNGTRWRLWGIDAPESRQTCHDGWPAGVEAKHELEQLMARGPVRCEDRGHDRYRRTIGLCRAGRQDLGAVMVSTGMAWAFTRYSSDYVKQERAAIGSRLGVHAHDCMKAWDWRAGNRRDR